MTKIDYILIALSILIPVSIGIIVNLSSRPTAMDVYQGKTTLEITYKQGVVIDSVVVFKD